MTVLLIFTKIGRNEDEVVNGINLKALKAQEQVKRDMTRLQGLVVRFIASVKLPLFSFFFQMSKSLRSS